MRRKVNLNEDLRRKLVTGQLKRGTQNRWLRNVTVKKKKKEKKKR